MLGVLLAAALWYVSRPSPPPAPATAPSPTWSSVFGNNPQVVADYTPKPADFTLTVKILEKKCYGSAGCNVTFRIELAYSGQTLNPTKTYEVTYEVSGTDEQTYVNTLTVNGEKYLTDSREVVGTRTAKDELKAVVTGVAER